MTKHNDKSADTSAAESSPGAAEPSAVTQTQTSQVDESGVTAVYIHVPFCLHRCGYCDFTLVANQDDLIPDYLAALKNELESTAADHAFHGPRIMDTIFIGGGTPTHLSPSHLTALFSLLQSYFHLTHDGEFSVEANPDGLDDDRIRVLKDFGVNRLSLGVQSFDDDCLRLLERRHSAAEAIETIQRCSDEFDNLSADLIYAVPGQSLQSWTNTLKSAISLPLTHISTYGLTYEQGTPFYRRANSGELRRQTDETERQQYLTGIGLLKGAGFEHYEVSNFAKNGFRCRHNQTYWQGRLYFAAGPGAARYLNGRRSTNCRSVARWIRSWSDNSPCIHESEDLNPEEKARECMMLALRMIDGLNIEAFERRFGVSVKTLAGDAIQRHLAGGLLEYHGKNLRLTAEGLLLADSVVVDFL